MYQSKIRDKKKRAPRHRELIEPSEGQGYAIVTDMMGNGRVRVLCHDGKSRMGRIRGSMRRFSGKVIIEKYALVMITFRDWGEEDKVDIVHKFIHDEVHILLKQGDLPDVIIKELTQCSLTGEPDSQNDDYILFDDEQPSGITEEPSDDVDVDAI